MIILKASYRIVFTLFIFSSLHYGEATRITRQQRTRMMSEGFKVLDGEYNSKFQSLAMFMVGIDLYEFYYYADAVLISPQCFLTSANQIETTTAVSSDNYTVMVARTGCDRIYHLDRVYLSDPSYSEALAANDISIAKTRSPVIMGSSCKGPEVSPTWISCDPWGPPGGFDGCYATSFGNAETSYYWDSYYFTAGDLVIPNQASMTILTPDACAAVQKNMSDTVPFDVMNQICAQTPDGMNVKCDYDENPILFCKNWKDTSSVATGGGWNSNTVGGWSSHSKSSDTKGKTQGSGWSPTNAGSAVKYEHRLAVGHWVHAYNVADDASSDYCRGTTGADLFVKYGSPTYTDLFAKCGLVCSNTLKWGYKCQGDPPKDLGDVYCIPERIGSPSNPPTNGWRP